MNTAEKIEVEHLEPESRAVATRPAGAVVQTPMALLTHAVESGASVETMEKLMALHERWEANQARRAFDAAMAEAKAKIPVIAKNRKVDYQHAGGGGRTTYQHEDLGEIARTVDPILAEHGLSYRFQTTANPNEPVTVTCIVSHRDGYSERNTLSAGRDESGKKNSIQAIGSTITYLQRYTLKAALGLAAAADDDGKASEEPAAPERPYISEEQEAALRDLIAAAGTTPAEFCAQIKVPELATIYADKYRDACTMLKQRMERGR
jgi:hypothetical protein